MGRKMIKRLIAGMLTAAVAIPTNFMPVQAAKQTAEDYVIVYCGCDRGSDEDGAVPEPFGRPGPDTVQCSMWFVYLPK